MVLYSFDHSPPPFLYSNSVKDSLLTPVCMVAGISCFKNSQHNLCKAYYMFKSGVNILQIHMIKYMFIHIQWINIEWLAEMCIR